MAASDEKSASRDGKVDHVLDHHEDDEKKGLPESNAEVDYTGVARKTDPAEIKLVRKLDYRIMVCIGSMLCDRGGRS
jgi:hypothetical protein